MKKQTLSVAFTLLMVCAALLLTHCKSKQVTSVPPEETHVEVLCSGPDYFSNSEYFRANSVGESTNQANSKRMALSNAREQLAGQLEVTVKAVIDNYVQDIAVGERQEFSQRYEGLSREVINQRLAGTKVICEEVTRTQEGRYRTYIAIELTGNEILNAMNDRISRDERLRLDYYYDKFKNTFNEEMEKMESDRGY